VPNPSDFILTRGLGAALERLGRNVDVVIVDGPPLLLSAEALDLSSKLDGLLILAQIESLRRGRVAELNRVLATSPAVKLGVVVTGRKGPRGRAYDYYYATRPRRQADRQPADKHLVT
jgi:Mrp family chromosome partitioning ATPase